MSLHQIDDGLKNYYNHKNTRYLNDDGIGKFIAWAEESGFDADNVEEELNALDPSTCIVDFDDEFPTDKIGDDRNEEIFLILEICWRLKDAFKESADISKYDIYKQNVTWNQPELLVFGYIKKLQLSQDIPNVIKEIIIKFVSKFCFNWNHSKYEKDTYKFYDEDPSLLTRLQPALKFPDPAFLVMKHVLSLDVNKKFEWEIQIQSQSPRYDWIRFSFGFVGYPIEKSIKKWTASDFGRDAATRSKQFGIYVGDLLTHFKGCGHPDQNGKCISENLDGIGKIRDTFGMIVDFEAKNIAWKYNGKDYGVIYNDIPDKIHVAVCVTTPTDFKCTKYEFQ